MILVVHEKPTATALYQKFTVGAKDLQVVKVGIHLYRHGLPSGSLYIQILDAGGTPIVTSSDPRPVHTDLASATYTYWHGYYRFTIPCALKKNTTYQIALGSSGYAFSESAYYGWCGDHTWRKVAPLYSPAAGANSPMDFELFVTDYPEKGTY